MGLDTTHDAWHGAYSAFMRWRTEIAKVAGMPPLSLMEGFFEKGSVYDPLQEWAKLCPNQSDQLYSSLPIRWDSLRPDPLHKLLFHSDCDGEIAAEDCGPIADRLEELMPLLPKIPNGGHIGDWRDKTQQFIDGLRDAASRNEPVKFH